MFIGLPLNDGLKNYISGIISDIDPSRKYTWEPPEKWHITLKFLGDVEDSKLTDLSKSLELAILDFSNFLIKVNQLGCFGGRHNPKILWAGAVSDEKLMKLSEKVFDVCDKSGFAPEERKFHPHITLLRVKKELELSFIEKFLNFKVIPQQFLCEKIIIYKSLLTRTGSVYSAVKTYNLNNSIKE